MLEREMEEGELNRQDAKGAKRRGRREGKRVNFQIYLLL
jgi:hypothetical protein